MELVEGAEARSANCGDRIEEIGVDSLQFGEEIRRLMSVPVETGSSFTALLELPANQAMELLHSTETEEKPTELPAEPWNNCSIEHPVPFQCTPIFPSNAALIDRACKFSVFATAEISPETSSMPSNSSANFQKVKQEPADSDSNLNSSPAFSDPTGPNTNPKSTKRKEREKKLKASSKKSKTIGNEASEDGEKLPYVHVRARRGQATDSHSLAERARREKINARMKLLQQLVPGCNKITGTAMVLDEIINHVQSLQRQVEFLSMRLAAVNPRIDFNIDSLFAAERGCLIDNDFSLVGLPSMYPEGQHHPQLWHSGELNQAVWDREENPSLVTPEHSLLSYNSSGNSASLHSKLVKMEL